MEKGSKARYQDEPKLDTTSAREQVRSESIQTDADLSVEEMRFYQLHQFGKQLPNGWYKANMPPRMHG